ncbi:MAG TPA: hypothetical protein VIF88_12940 [Methylocystis sp.]
MRVALGVSRATLFRLIERFKTEKTVSALLPRKCGRAAGSKNDDPKRDRLIFGLIEFCNGAFELTDAPLESDGAFKLANACLQVYGHEGT